MIRNLLLALATTGALVGGGALALDTAAGQSDDTPPPRERIVIGLDLSKSNPLIADPAFAAKVGERIGAIIGALGFGSEVHVRTFGNYDATSNNFAYDAVLSVRNRPGNVAAEVQRLIASTPMLVKSGKWRAQDNTNILAFLDNLSEGIGCAGLPTTVILASDGIEDSDYARLGRDEAHLPAPQGTPFKGCAAFEVLGLGEGTKSPRTTTRLRGEWAGWAHAAGFARFEGLNDW